MDTPIEELIRRVKLNDKQAFVELFDRYSGKVLGYLYHYIGNYQTAEDLTIETFNKVFASIKAYEEEGNFLAWLYRIATNCAKSELRRRFRRPAVSLEKEIESSEGKMRIKDIIADERYMPDRNIKDEDIRREVRRAIMKIKDDFRQVLILCDLNGLSYEEVAKVLHINPVTVGTRLKRARAMLYAILKDMRYEL